ncbi:hypothetical protein OQ252_04270 [Acetobacter farinalis]|uniref:Uncharacterized protein n=1 Tax=Acetobacter farinalis TaxID=1260984 RepID=A0ABT3Q5Q6_9PROT|nr:hypothetical protein [Acetobacter farinalis]MCX2560618.1 hypothetical protein [Acetobacter farinalis]NHO29240.1 hypothetical protein [Acetobacter farinalis]
MSFYIKVAGLLSACVNGTGRAEFPGEDKFFIITINRDDIQPMATP